MDPQLNSIIAERDRYRGMLYQRIIRDTTADMVTRFGGRSKVLNIVVESQLAVREFGNRFEVYVVDQATKTERLGVGIADLLTEMRSSAEFTGAFDAKPSSTKKLANNPWHPDSENLTQQALLLRRNPDMAARLRREAGALSPQANLTRAHTREAQ